MSSRLPPIEAVSSIEHQVQSASAVPRAVASSGSAAIQSSSGNVASQEEGEDSGMIDGRPMTKAEKQNAKKKRRKEREKAAKAEETVAQEEAQRAEKERAKRKGMEEEAVRFRLFSSHPVSDVKLLAKQDYPFTSYVL